MAKKILATKTRRYEVDVELIQTYIHTIIPGVKEFLRRWEDKKIGRIEDWNCGILELCSNVETSA